MFLNYDLRKTTQFIAFTLAETLIVMGIIGIVSALTLPNLNSSTGDKERVAKVKKIYRDLNDALGRAEAVYGPFEDWFVNTDTDFNKRAGERITEFFKSSKICGTTDNSCFTAMSPDVVSSDYKFITADGSSVGIRVKGVGEEYPFMHIPLDIDGPSKGSSTGGKDSFTFVMTGSNYNDALQKDFYSGTFSDLVATCYLGDSFSSATWILRYDNADYLKFTNNSGKCPNNTTVSEANPRCK